MIYGTVTKYFEDRGFGFIKRDDHEPDVFVHANHVETANDLMRGDRVSFEVETSKSGKPQACKRAGNGLTPPGGIISNSLRERTPHGYRNVKFRRIRENLETNGPTTRRTTGNQNAVTHGLYSAPVRAARCAEAEARYQRHLEYAKTVPPIDYKAICEATRRGRPPGERSTRQH